MSDNKSIINFRQIENDFVNGIKHDNDIYFPTITELSKKYNIDTDIINDYFDSNSEILNERKLNITTYEKRKLFSTSEGIVEYINNLDGSFIDVGEEIINNLKVSFMDAIAEGRSKEAESWVKIMEKYYTIINNIKQERQTEILRKESENFENNNSAMSEKLLVMVERVLKEQISDDDIIDIKENGKRKRINARKTTD